MSLKNDSDLHRLQRLQNWLISSSKASTKQFHKTLEDKVSELLFYKSARYLFIQRWKTKGRSENIRKSRGRGVIVLISQLRLTGFETFHSWGIFHKCLFSTVENIPDKCSHISAHDFYLSYLSSDSLLIWQDKSSQICPRNLCPRKKSTCQPEALSK